jgi:ATP-dependent exoDNAse (exonuclease V) alpha subunit
MVKNYINDIKNGKQSLVISSQNKDKDYLNKEIRYQLKKIGKLTTNGITVKCRSGDDKKEFEREFVVGDKITFLKNNKVLGVQNGLIGEIVGIDWQNNMFTVKTKDSQIISFDVSEYNHIDHGYALTTYKSQGQTVDVVHYDANSKSSLLSRNEFYVGISRERYEARLYTNSKEKLADRIDKFQSKVSALEEWEKFNNTRYQGQHKGQYNQHQHQKQQEKQYQEQQQKQKTGGMRI